MHFDVQRRPPKETALTSGERVFLVLFCLLVFGGFAAEIVRDFEPVKLSALFFLAAWLGLTFVHEAGHALAARAFRWRVRQLVVGFGPLLSSFKVSGIPVEVRLFPIGGFVMSTPTTLDRARLASACIYGAGPGAELAVAGLVTLALGLDVMTTRTDSIGVIAAQSVALAALFGALFNLVPFTTASGAPSDGLGLATSPFLTPRHFRARMAGPEMDEAYDLLARGHVAAAIERFEKALEAHPEVTDLHLGLALALEQQGRRMEGLMLLQARLRDAELEPGERARLESAQAALRG